MKSPLPLQYFMCKDATFGTQCGIMCCKEHLDYINEGD